MTRQQIADNLTKNHQAFIAELIRLSDEDFMYSPPGKWTAGQQLAHIIKSVRPVNAALALPSFVLKLLFGTSNRPSKSYEELVKKYKEKLAQGGKAPSRFLPPAIDAAQRTTLIASLEKTVAQVASKSLAYSDEQLDALLLPHPLLGKLTLREMFYFTIYHVQHHQQLAKRNLAGKH